MALNLKMNLDKKSLIQIVVLVVLIAVGAGAYFMQQGGGGLDFGFITGFFESKPTTTRAPAAKSQAPAADRKSGDRAGGGRRQGQGRRSRDSRAARQGTNSRQAVCR